MSPASLIELLRLRSAEAPGHQGYTFLVDGESEEAALTYGEFDRQARAIGAWLQANGARGERALLLFPPGNEYLTAFFGCLYAGVVAVPAYPPDVTRLNRSLPRLEAMVRDARARFVLTTEMIHGMAGMLFEQAPELAGLTWVATDALAPGLEDGWKDPGVTGDALAFLQYTSGSTGSPKGVMLTHRNLLANLALIHRAFGHSRDSKGVIWLPPYHDMGLIGGLLQPLYGGFPVVLMSPIAFLQRPFRWLQAVSRYGATTSGGPNFAYDLCVRKVSAEERATLDLSRWKVAFNGAEPIRPETLERFHEAFAPQGFRREAFYPCYGLAESTLIVTGHALGTAPVTDGVNLVGSGRVLEGNTVRLVDARTGRECAPGEEGEIWVAGASVGQGYWERPEESARVFHARVEGAGPDDGRYLRTGDLGVLRGGELFVTGRIKDLIILRGRNLYPQDVESTTVRVHPALRPGCTAAFSVELEGEERLVIVQEVDARHAGTNLEALARSIREAVAQAHDAQAHDVVLIQAGSLPKTSSGKVQRYACRQAWLAGELEVLGQSTLQSSVPSVPTLSPEQLLAIPELERAAFLEASLVDAVAARLRLPRAHVDAERALISLGLDSLATVELKSDLDAWLGTDTSLARLMDAVSLRALARELVGTLGQRPLAPTVSGDALGRHPVSEGQKALWLAQRLAPESTANHLAFAVRFHTPADVPTLREALTRLVARHPALRTTFHLEHDGELVQQVHPASGGGLLRDATSLPLEDSPLRDALATEASRPFDLEQGPLLRASLYAHAGGGQVLLLAAHHLILDLWSLALLAEELHGLYPALKDGRASESPSPALRPSDFARWQRPFLEGPDGERLFSYWHKQLDGVPDVLELPTDRARPAVRAFRGAACTFRLDAELTRRLRALAREEGTTLFSLLLAAWQVLLARHAGQERFAVGSPAAGRTRSGLEDVVGYHVNPVALVADLSGDPSFRAHLGRVRRTVLEALEHQEYPFPLLVERLRRPRDASRSPLFQAVFAWEQPHRREELTPLVLGLPGVRVRFAGLEAESVPVELGTAQFDLALQMADAPSGLDGALRYDTDLFDADTAGRMVARFTCLLAGIAADSDQRVSALPLLPDAEQERVRTFSAGVPVSASFTPVHHAIAARAALAPEALAIASDGRQWTYGMLEQQARVLARRLRQLGVGPDVRAGVLMHRSPEQVLALLGILKAGGAYVPLDPDAPQARLEALLEDVGAAVVLTTPELRSRLPASVQVLDDVTAQAHGVVNTSPEQHPRVPASVRVLDDVTASAHGAPDTELDSTPDAAHLAYVIYTSGSTGRPKGVQLTHGGLAHFAGWYQRTFALSPADRATHLSTPVFDASVLEVWPALISGASLHLPGDDVRALPERLVEWLAAERITHTFLTTALAEGVLGQQWPETLTLRELTTGGDQLRRRPSARTPFRVTNLYGPTEGTVAATFAPVGSGDAASGLPTIGRPLDGMHVHVLDASLRPQPLGVAGELCIGGPGVARGYLDRPDLTARAFVPDPFSTVPGARLYRTGDLARVLPDGELQFLGRLDHQVKLRGFRIELGEIESVLQRHPDVRQCVVAVRDEPPTGKRLVAYVVAAPDAALTGATLREHVRRELPEVMCPAAFVLLPALPLTPTGKVDRQALPAPELESPTSPEDAAPRTATEQKLAGLWTELLGGTVGLHEDWFALGGHSLLAARLLARVREVFGVELPLRTLFEAPTVASLAARIDGGVRAPTPGPALKHRPDRAPEAPLSYAQERLWFLDQLEPGDARYHLPAAVRLQGPLDVAALRRGLDEVVRRHEALRTTFSQHQGRATQRVHAHVPFELPEVDLSNLSPTARDAEVHQLAKQEARAPFSLAQGPLLRGRLLRLGTDEHVLLLTLHHIVADGESVAVLLRELGALYVAFSMGAPPALAPLPLQYIDFALWQREWLADGVLERQLAHWKQRLAGAPGVLELPTDRPRPAVRTLAGGRHAVHLPAALAGGLAELGRSEGATPFMTLLAAFQMLLLRYTGQDDLVVGCPLSNRTRVETEGLIGFFVNTLPLRTDASGNPTFRQLLGRVRESVLAAHEHQDVPFEKLVEALAVERDLGRTPLFQVAFSYQDAPLPSRALQGLHLTLLESESAPAKFDLDLALERGEDGGLTARFEYDADLFDAASIARLAEHFHVLLSSIAADPDGHVGDLALMTAEERTTLLHGWNPRPVAPPSHVSVHARFGAWAERTPDALAVAFAGEALTYGQLEARANRLAWHLRDLGVGPDVPVVLCLERSTAFVEAALGVLKAGGAYVPLDPSAPPERLQSILEDVRAPVLLASRNTAALTLPPGCQCLLAEDGFGATGAPAHAPPELTGPRHLAYVIYTSGSTGRPKGVELEHAGLAHLVDWHQRTYALTPEDRTTQAAGPAFDAAVWELWPTLAAGASLHIVDDEVRALPERLVAWLTGERITRCFLPTPLAEAVLTQPWPANTALRTLLTGGDRLHRGAPEGTPFQLINHYGPTECTVVATCGPVSAGAVNPPIGRPIANTQAYVLDARQQPVPVGVPGELWLGGLGLARGYLNHPELTARAFVPHPFDARDGARLYRTGDRVRFLPDGALEFLGRTDAQVKLRGLRIELGEVESLALEHPAVRQAIATVREDGPGGKRLVLHAVVAPGQACTEGDLKAHLRRRLPESVMPSAIMFLDALPLTLNGKVDRRALPAPDATPRADGVAPRDATEQRLADIWTELLGTPRVGVHDDFFELGGNSLLATQVISRVRESFGVDVPLRSAFEARTVAALAQVVSRQAEVRKQPLLTARAPAEAPPQVEGLSEAELDALIAELESGEIES
ncbi:MULTISPECIES: non-ribosomal peptide synthetase [unclassified Corallococcus]|uniref:non-ribosomal peptide synthetase n=1 Tax=unclassified Corallococcus TaxID=2685029 RepID=UPI001A8F3C9D|nr:MULTISPECIES: non-ribosomal peptide synthetase [unclassified Corallococcus]MBN9681067.1 amino acid adenylation domain-containing protein [Corallococcus sp. NCSPR001]WAS87339.1 non-ribosomal peptide synthetase [Corallococcus sp. NCRR]